LKDHQTDSIRNYWEGKLEEAPRLILSKSTKFMRDRTSSLGEQQSPLRRSTRPHSADFLRSNLEDEELKIDLARATK